MQVWVKSRAVRRGGLVRGVRGQKARVQGGCRGC
jgi:hypothetical protein